MRFGQVFVRGESTYHRKMTRTLGTAFTVPFCGNPSVIKSLIGTSMTTVMELITLTTATTFCRLYLIIVLADLLMKNLANSSLRSKTQIDLMLYKMLLMLLSKLESERQDTATI